MQCRAQSQPATRSTVRPSPGANYERVESNIGEGTYGKVHKARDLRTGQLVAVKKTKASAENRDVGGIGFTALREIKLMQAVKHSNVIGCHDVFVEDGSVHIVMDFMDTDLKRVLQDKSLAFTEAHVQCLSKQLLEAVGALHHQWFIHRDVTPMNVLLSCSTGVAKLCDFGFTRTITADDKPMTAMCTTLWYRAPELLYGARLYGPAVDVWSSGCVIGEMFTREALFKGRGDLDMLTRIFEKRGTPSEENWKDVSALPSYIEFSFHPEVPMERLLPAASSCSPVAASFVRSLLALDPKKRPDAKQALGQDFLTRPGCEARELPFVGKQRSA